MNITKNWYWKWDGALSSEFCDLVVNETNWDFARSGTVGKPDGSFSVDDSIRSTKVVFKDPLTTIGSVLQAYMNAANQYAEWNYVLSNMEEVQIGEYSEDEKSYYSWHIDSAPPQNGMQRKLSGVVLLSDPSDFEGGKFEMRDLEKENLLPVKGSILVFPSFIEHQVTRITKGTRYSAVAWISGPAFR